MSRIQTQSSLEMWRVGFVIALIPSGDGRFDRAGGERPGAGCGGFRLIRFDCLVIGIHVGILIGLDVGINVGLCTRMNYQL